MRPSIYVRPGQLDHTRTRLSSSDVDVGKANVIGDNEHKEAELPGIERVKVGLGGVTILDGAVDLDDLHLHLLDHESQELVSHGREESGEHVANSGGNEDGRQDTIGDDEAGREANGRAAIMVRTVIQNKQKHECHLQNGSKVEDLNVRLVMLVEGSDELHDTQHDSELAKSGSGLLDEATLLDPAKSAGKVPLV